VLAMASQHVPQRTGRRVWARESHWARCSSGACAEGRFRVPNRRPPQRPEAGTTRSSPFLASATVPPVIVFSGFGFTCLGHRLDMRYALSVVACCPQSTKMAPEYAAGNSLSRQEQSRVSGVEPPCQPPRPTAAAWLWPVQWLPRAQGFLAAPVLPGDRGIPGGRGWPAP